MGLRTARALAAIAFIASLLAIVPAVAIVSANGPGLDARVLWTLVPILSAGGAFLLARRPHIGPMWLLAGTCSGFAVLGAMSLGIYFAPAAILLLVAAIAHMTAMRVRWQAILFPLWFLTGATGVCVLFLVSDLLEDSPHVHVSPAPALVFGAEVFAGLVLLMAALALVASQWPAQRSTVR